MTTKIAEIPNRAACAAWSPVLSQPGVVAIGIKDSGGVGFENTGGELELYDTSSIDETTKAPSLLASLKTSARFACILWVKPTSETMEFPLGLILGGMADGVLYIWDPQQLLEQPSSPDEAALLALVSFGDDSAGSITALNTSPLDPTQLCVGASNGQVTIVDLKDPRNPQHWDPAPSHKKQTSGITAVEWNTAVAHIVATAAGDGSVVVWDVKSQKAWCEIRAEQTGQAVADIHWNPAEGLHLLTASADDRNPVLRLWDLAASTSMPLATLPGHVAGLLSTSWCPHDQNLLLSCAKDHRTLLWDLATMQPISELPADSGTQQQQDSAQQLQQQQQQAQDPRALFASSSLDHQKHLRVQVLWSPIKRGVALTCSLDRKVQIHSVLSLATKTGRPPAWMKPTACVSTGFGGMVVSCYSNQPNSRWLMIQTVQEESEFAAQVVQQETERANSTELDFCKAQVKKTNSSAHPWGFMRVIFESNARQELLEHLNFTADDIAARAQELADGMGALTVSAAADDPATSGGITMSEAAQDIVKKALLIGDFEAAVECCFQSQSFADALLLASCGGAELWSKTQQRYFEQEAPKRPFLSIASAIIRNQLDELVTESDLAQWQETLAILSTYGQSDEFPRLCIALGDRLEEAGDHESASNCYMCALHLEGAVRYWKEQVGKATKHSGAKYDLDSLHDFCLKVSVLRQATGGATELPSDVCALFNQYAKVLADQGLYATAAKYSQDDPNDPSSLILRDRLYRSRASQRCYVAMGVAPEFPYTMVAVEQSRGQYSASALREQKRQQEMQQQAMEEQRKQQEAAMEQQRRRQQQQAAQQLQAAQATPAPQSPTDELPPGWIALQDPASGQTYYANQATGETTWDLPQPPAPAVSQPLESSSYHSQSGYAGANGQVSGSASVKSANSTQRSTKAALTSKYGDGFVTSSSHPELADKYGNIGTGNPYGAERPGTAAAVVGGPKSENAPVSGSLNFDGHSLTGDHLQVKDTLLGVAEALKATPLNPVEKRQVSEAEKGVAILVKKLALGSLSDGTVGKVYNLLSAVMNRDFRAAMSIQTDLANHDWKDHKDWLKGMKILLQLASKKLS